MLEAITLKGFRKYKEIKISGFGRVNFILGDNNVGKTTILEGIYAWACGQNIAPFMNVPLARGRYVIFQQPYWMMEEVLAIINDRYKIPMEMSFVGMDDGKEVAFEHRIYPSDVLTEYDSTYKKFSEKIVPSTNAITGKEQPIIQGLQGMIPQYNPVLIARWDIKGKDDIVSVDIKSFSSLTSAKKPYKSAKFIDLLSHTAVAENVQIYGALKREALLDEVTNKMREIFPEIKGFDMIPYPDGSQAPVSVVKNDGTILPMYAFGDGVQRWFYIIGAISLHKNSIICIDEIDTGFHHNAHANFGRNIIEYAKENNVQLFLSTHNKEFIDEFLNINNDQDVKVYTVKDVEGNNKIRCLNAVEAMNARNEYGVELR